MKRKWIIIAAVVAGVLVLAVIGVEMFLRHAVRNGIEQALGGANATVEMGRVSVSLPRRAVSVRDVKIKAQNNDPARRGERMISLDVTLGDISVSGIGYRRVGGLPVLRARRLMIDAPHAMLVTDGKGGNEPESDSTPPKKSLRQTLSEKLASLAIDEIEVRGAALEVVQWVSENESTRATLGGGEISAKGFTLDSLPADIAFSADSVVYGFGSGAKVLRADSIVLDGAAGRLSLGHFALVPQFPKEEFARVVKTHEDWTAITLEGVACSGIDFARFVADTTLSIDSVALASVDIASYKNRKIFQQPRTKKMLYEAVQDLPIPVDVATLVFDNLAVRYDELSEKGTSPGTVLLSGGHGTAVNVTNIAEDNERFMTVDVDALFMAGGEVKARFLFPVASSDDHWELSGRLGATDMEVFNRVIEPLMDARITSGRINGLDFNIVGTLRQSHSRLTMAYNDFKLEFLDKRDRTQKRNFLSFLVDDILVRSDNPGRDGRGRLREAEGGYTRDPERSMWHYVWHSLQPAILKTVI